MTLAENLLFDTHAFLAYFTGEAGTETVKALMDAVQNGEAEGFVAAISLTELAYIYKSRVDESTARLRVMQITNSKIATVPLTADIALRAGILKRPGISIADAVIAASAESVDAAVVTSDPHFAEMGVKVAGYRGNVS